MSCSCMLQHVWLGLQSLRDVLHRAFCIPYVSREGAAPKPRTLGGITIGSVTFPPASNTHASENRLADRRHRSDADARSTGSAMTRAAWCRPRISMPHRSTPRTRPTRPIASTCPLSSGVAQANELMGSPRLDPEATATQLINPNTPWHGYCVGIYQLKRA